MDLGQQGMPGEVKRTKVMVSCSPQPPGTHPAHTRTGAGSAGAELWGSCREAGAAASLQRFREGAGAAGGSHLAQKPDPATP